MYLKTFLICILKYITWPCPLYFCTWISMGGKLKEDAAKLDWLELMTDRDKLLMVVNGRKRY